VAGTGVGEMSDLVQFLKGLGWEAHEEQYMPIGDTDDEEMDDISSQMFSFGPYDASLASGNTWASLQIYNEEEGTVVLQAKWDAAGEKKFRAMVKKLTAMGHC